MARTAHAWMAGAALAMIAAGTTRSAQGSSGFDGAWDTQVACENAGGALGYVFQFPSQVAGGHLEGGKGEQDQPGWFRIAGVILPNGSALLTADGLVGASQVAVGHRPVGTEYSYHIKATFARASGSGDRVEGRPCHVTFQKK